MKTSISRMKHINLKKEKREVDKTPSLEEPSPAVTWEHINPSSGVEEQVLVLKNNNIVTLLDLHLHVHNLTQQDLS
jgi:hypothetical protein